MAKTKNSTKRYYQKNKKYREELIKKETEKHKRNRPKYAKEQREYYKDSEEYRSYKKKYAKAYRKREPIKSLPRTKRKAVRRLWQAEKAGQGVRRYQAEHRQYFAA